MGMVITLRGMEMRLHVVCSEIGLEIEYEYEYEYEYDHNVGANEVKRYVQKFE